MKETIKDFSGLILGYIEDRGNELVATNFYGAILGYYRKEQDITTDFYGKIVARGNILSGLIYNDRR